MPSGGRLRSWFTICSDEILVGQNVYTTNPTFGRKTAYILACYASQRPCKSEFLPIPLPTDKQNFLQSAIVWAGQTHCRAVIEWLIEWEEVTLQTIKVSVFYPPHAAGFARSFLNTVSYRNSSYKRPLFGPAVWQLLQPNVAQIRVHNNLPAIH